MVVPSSSINHVAMQAKTGPSPSTPHQEFWFLDSRATNNMTSDISNLQMITPYPSSETVTSANVEGLIIKHVGNACLNTPSQSFRLNYVLHVPKLSQHLLSMNQLCRDNKCRCIVDEYSLCIQDKVIGKMLYQ